MSTLIRRLSHQRGTTLVELLVVIPLGLLIFGAVLTISGIFVSGEKATAQRTQGIEAQQIALGRMTHDIREASGHAPITSPDALTLTYTWKDAGKPDQTIAYDCSEPADDGAPGTDCWRTVTAADGTELSHARVLTGVTNDDVFSGTANYVAIHVKVHVPGKSATTTMTLRDGAQLANAGPA
jgi:Tfp pilus assembly protein PilW